MKDSVLILHPLPKKTRKLNSLGVNDISKQSMINAIDSAVRDKRLNEEFKQQIRINRPHEPLAPGNATYSDIFKKLLENCRCYFTSEYGKNNDEFKRFFDSRTKEYETTHDGFVSRERLHYFQRKTSREYYAGQSSEYLKKSRSFHFKSFKNSSLKDFRLNNSLRKKSNRSKYSSKIRKGISKKLLSPDTNRSASELSESLSEIGILPTAFEKKNKPFIFKLSDVNMIKQGITANFELPIRITIFESVLSSPLGNWSPTNNKIPETFYPDGKVCTQLEQEGDGKVYYENGQAAISFTQTKLGLVIIVFSKSKKSYGKSVRQIPVAMFDLKGHGVVYNADGNRRLVYDQSEGILIDTPSKLPIRWKWDSYDQIMCLMKELEFVPTTTVRDFDYQKSKIEKNKKVYDRLILKKAKYSNWSISTPEKFSANKRTTKVSTALPKISRARNLKNRWKNWKTSQQYFSGKVIGDLEKKYSNRTNPDFPPKVLKFLDKGFIIRPLMTPCEEILNKPYRQASTPPKNKFYVGTLFDSSKRKLTDKNIKDRFDETPKKSTARTHRNSRKSNLKLMQNKIAKFIKKRKTFTSNTKLLPSSTCRHQTKFKSVFKPIIMKLTDNVSLTIRDQEHIHIDFSSYPMHFMFNIGVKIITEKVEMMYEIKDVKRNSFPAVFPVLELLKKKCRLLYDFNMIIEIRRMITDNKVKRENMKKLLLLGIKTEIKNDQ